MCLIFGSMGVKASPDMRIIIWSSSIEPDGTISLRVGFEYENAYQKIVELILWYSVNSYAYDQSKMIYLDTDRPETVEIKLSTSGLVLKDGDIIMLRVVCKWEAVFVYGTLTDKITVDVKEYPTRRTIGLGTILGIVFGGIALITLITILLVRRKIKKSKRELKI